MAILYAAVLAAVSFLLLIRGYFCRWRRLVSPSIDPRLVRAPTIRAVLTVLIFGLPRLLTWVRV